MCDIMDELWPVIISFNDDSVRCMCTVHDAGELVFVARVLPPCLNDPVEVELGPVPVWITLDVYASEQ